MHPVCASGNLYLTQAPTLPQQRNARRRSPGVLHFPSQHRDCASAPSGVTTVACLSFGYLGASRLAQAISRKPQAQGRDEHTGPCDTSAGHCRRAFTGPALRATPGCSPSGSSTNASGPPGLSPLPSMTPQSRLKQDEALLREFHNQGESFPTIGKDTMVNSSPRRRLPKVFRIVIPDCFLEHRG
jgi:hypothetical protein